MQTGEIIQRIQSLYSKGAQSQSTRLMRRHIYSKMTSIRALLFYNKINKRQKLSLWNYTTLPCVELEVVSENDCPCDPIPGCDILKTKYTLPKPINSISGYIIDSVMSVNGRIIFDEVSYKSKIWRKGDKYTSKKSDWFIKDDYLYITSTRKLKSITIVGLFADPVEAINYSTNCTEEEVGCPTSPIDMDFPIDEELVDALVELTVQELTVGFKPGHEDRRNDGQDKLEVPQTEPRGRQQRQSRQQKDE